MLLRWNRIPLLPDSTLRQLSLTAATLISNTSSDYDGGGLLNAAGGVQKFLVEQDIGFRASIGVVVPIVPTAVIFDLDIVKRRVYPDRWDALARRAVAHMKGVSGLDAEERLNRICYAVDGGTIDGAA